MAADNLISDMQPMTIARAEEEDNASTATLPPPETRRWVIRRKAAVVQAVRSGTMSLEEACTRYNLSVEEFLSWQRLIDRHGLRGLRTTRLQEYRAAAEQP